MPLFGNSPGLLPGTLAFPTMQRLGGFKAAASAAASPIVDWSGLLNTQTFDHLLIFVQVPNYAGADIVSLQFNGDTTAANYQTRWITLSNAATPILAGIDFTTTPSIALGPTAITGGRNVIVSITNIANRNKIMNINEQELFTAQGTAPQLAYGGGQYFNTSVPIYQVQLVLQGANSFGTNTSMIVFGNPVPPPP
jgi:hypothetical protein